MDHIKAFISRINVLLQIHLTPAHVFIYLVTFNLILYIERGIIPGSNREFVQFIQETITTDSPDTYIGLLQSAFVAGLSIMSPFAGHIVHKISPKLLIFITLLIWNLAVFLTGFAGWIKSYLLLLAGRILSGIGEAAFISIVPAFIMHYGGQRKGRWLSIYLFMLPFGAALGFGYGGIVANSSLGWPFSFILLDTLAVLLTFTVLFVPRAMLALQHKTNENSSALHNYNLQESIGIYQCTTDQLIQHTEQLEVKNETSVSVIIEGCEVNSIEELSNDDKSKITLISELEAILLKPLYWCMIGNCAAYSASIIALHTFITSFVLALGLLQSETHASILLGTLISFSGILGTLLGGFLADLTTPSEQVITHISNNIEENEDSLNLLQIFKLSKVGTYVSFIGCVFMILTPFMTSIYFFLILPILGLIFIFSTVAISNLILMLSVPTKNQPLAIAISVVLQHVLGDVPSQIFIGFLKDLLAPHCVYEQEESTLNPKCFDEQFGIRLTLLVISLWLIWIFITFILSCIITYKPAQRQIRLSQQSC